MTLSMLVEALYPLSLNHSFDGEELTQDSLKNKIESVLSCTGMRTFLTVNLPDGEWAIEVSKDVCSNHGYGYNYFIPRSRVEEVILMKHPHTTGKTICGPWS